MQFSLPSRHFNLFIFSYFRIIGIHSSSVKCVEIYKHSILSSRRYRKRIKLSDDKSIGRAPDIISRYCIVELCGNK
jgi:hypothetical protein